MPPRNGSAQHDDAARLLSSPLAQEWIRAAVTGDPDDRGTVRVQLDRVHHRPDSDTSAGFHVSINADGHSHDEYIVATTAQIADDKKLAVVEHDDMVLRFWRHPDDPRLPALTDACDPEVVAGWLGADPDQVELEVLAYRPLRRAVIRAQVGPQSYFIKVLLAERATAQLARHRIMSEAGVGPHLVAEPAPGVLIVAAAEGEPLAERFAAQNTGGPPVEPQIITELLDRLPDELVSLPRRSPWCDRLDFHAAAAAVALPDVAEEISALAASIDAIIDQRPHGPTVPVHGDLYEANIFVAGHGAEARHTLIDLDTIGPGYRVDDLACVLAHLAVLPDLSAAHYDGLIDTVEHWRAHFETHVDPAALRARVAGVILTLVAGTTRAHALARLDLVRSWLLRAQMADR